jgi:hypothetical protein
MSRVRTFLSVLLALLLSITTPIVHAITNFFRSPPPTSAPTPVQDPDHIRPVATGPPAPAPDVRPKKNWREVLVSVLLLPLTPWGADETPNTLDAATPQLLVGEVFINKMLVLGSGVCLVQTTTSSNYLGGWAYDSRSYARVTQAAPSASARFIEGIAVDGAGAVHILDASFGLPPNVRWVGGLPLTTSCQLCVVFG